MIGVTVMPLIKPISGHTATKNVRRYLTRGGRALAADYLNLAHDSLMQHGDASLPLSYDWATDMDRMRATNHGDDPWQGKRARTYKHYIISPDPQDGITLDRLRELAVAWAHENFGDYQIAIVYHNDNENRIPHAHVIVNNINLATGHRLQDPRPDELNRRLQRMADERSLHSFGRDEGKRDGFQARAAAKAQRKPPLSLQNVYVRKAEAEIAAKGGYSWVSDIRSRVSLAKSLAENEEEFKDVLCRLGVDVSDNSPKSDRRDWIYSFAGHGTRRISGERLGLSFGRESIRSGFLRTDILTPSHTSRRQILDIAKNALTVDDLADLRRLADALQVNARYEIDCIEDYGQVIEDMRARKDAGEEIEALIDARGYSATRGLLPQRTEREVKRLYSHGFDSAGDTWDGSPETGGKNREQRAHEGQQRDDWER